MTERIWVIGGGESAEHDVSAASAAAVIGALREAGRHVEAVHIARDGTWHRDGAPLGSTPAAGIGVFAASVRGSDVVFPALHGSPGEDGAVAALCALLHVRCVGSPATAGAIAMDKRQTKAVAAAVGVRTLPHRFVPRGTSVVFDGHVVVKPVAAGSSHGVASARTPAELADALDDAFRFGDALVEPAVRAREIDVAVLREADGTRWAAPPLEILTPGLFDTATKYDGSAHFVVPAATGAPLERELRATALRMFDALGCSGLARMDFFVDGDEVLLNEVNTAPGMTAHSQAPRMFAAAGVAYGDLVTRLVDGAR